MKISIITATYNSGKTVGDTLKSVLAQTYHDYELLVVDGASKDNTLEVVKKMEPLFEGRMRYISEPDKGIYDAMNKGVSRCSGQWVIFMNAGDTFATDDVLHQVFSNKWDAADIVYGDVVKDNHVKAAPAHYLLYHRMLFCHQCVFVRRQCLVDIPFDINMEGETKESQEKEPEYFEGKRVLLVEDNELNQEIAIYMLKEKGLDVESVNNGEEAVVKYLSSTPFYYNLIRMDIVMPGMYGLEASRAIRS